MLRFYLDNLKDIQAKLEEQINLRKESEGPEFKSAELLAVSREAFEILRIIRESPGIEVNVMHFRGTASEVSYSVGGLPNKLMFYRNAVYLGPEIVDRESFVGKGFVVTEDQNQYFGGFSGGKFNGQGVAMFANGDFYQGGFKDGNFDSDEGLIEDDGVLKRISVIKYATGKLETYKGRFVNGKFNGRGDLKYRDGSEYEGSFRDGLYYGEGVHKYATGELETYKGLFVNGEFNGRGALKYRDGSEYDGGFRGGLYEGEGVHKLKDGTIYEGDFVMGVFSGKGVITYPSGARDAGDFCGGYLKFGISIDKDGNEYLGECNAKGQPHGYPMVMIYKKGDVIKYEGGFRNGLRDGVSCLVKKEDGTQMKCDYTHGELTKTFEPTLVFNPSPKRIEEERQRERELLRRDALKKLGVREGTPSFFRFRGLRAVERMIAELRQRDESAGLAGAGSNAGAGAAAGAGAGVVNLRAGAGASARALGEGIVTTAGAAEHRFDEENPERGTYITLPNGNKYQGGMVDGQFHGKGTLIFPSGGRYEGDFDMGVSHGKGTLTFVNGNKYTGDYVRGVREGKGVMTFSDGRKYIGDFFRGKYHGEGLMILPDGTRQEGDFVDNEFRKARKIVLHEDVTATAGDADVLDAYFEVEPPLAAAAEASTGGGVAALAGAGGPASATVAVATDLQAASAAQELSSPSVATAGAGSATGTTDPTEGGTPSANSLKSPKGGKVKKKGKGKKGGRK